MCVRLYSHFINVQLIIIHTTIVPYCLVIYLWFTEHVIYSIHVKDWDKKKTKKKHRIVLNQVHSFTPLLWNIIKHGVRRKINMDRLKPLKPLAKSWWKFTAKLEIMETRFYLIYDSYRIWWVIYIFLVDEKPDNVKSSLLLHRIGKRAREVCNTSFLPQLTRWN